MGINTLSFSKNNGEREKGVKTEGNYKVRRIFVTERLFVHVARVQW
jgi:hypothetical protein